MESSGNSAYQGRLGTTTRASVHVASDAGTTFTATVYSSINVADSADLLHELSSGALHRVADPSSSKTYQLAQPVLLHDPSRRVFSLLLPDALRHRESEERRRVLADLDKDDAAQPKYVRDFTVVYSVEAFKALATGSPEPAPAKGASSEEIEAAKASIAVERQQLADLRERFDKERGQLDGIEERLNAERSELKAARESLEAERRRLEAEKLNLEQRQIQELSGGPISNAEEATQVVTDDQFLERQGTEEAAELASEVSEIMDDGIEEFEPDHTLINPLTTGLPSRFAEY